ncbi:MAG: peroxide stress protein YaaA [Rickettsiales bacterium]|nr:peroxide stress protein YaaA [Rickettsiales bacterium]
MIILLSPSKTLEEAAPYPAITPTQPQLLEHTQTLAKIMHGKSANDMSALMKISEKLGTLNYDRYQSFQTPFTKDNARPCIFSFKGDVYDGLNIEQFDTDALNKAQQHLRVLSGLYGLLRPFDLMQPYRLEMGTRLQNPRGKNLYEFWGDRITELLNQELEQSGSDTIINLASNEYFKAINTKKLKGKLVTPVFKEIKGNEMKVVGLFAKRARGMMTRHLLTSNNPLESFVEANYRLDDTLSSDAERIFTRAA